jgi:hypothetical protein
MAETVDTQPGGLTEGVREGAKELRKDVSRDRIESRLEDVVEDKPLVRFILEMKTVLRAVAIAAVLTLIVGLLTSFKIASVVLVISFFAAWLGLAAREYNRRRPTKPVDTDDDEE